MAWGKIVKNVCDGLGTSGAGNDGSQASADFILPSGRHLRGKIPRGF